MARRKAFFSPPRSSGPKKTTLKGALPPIGSQPTQLPITPQVQPIDPIYLEQTGQNQLGLDNSLAGIDYQRGQLGQSTGFNALGQLDLSNPYNQATLLQRSYQQAQRGTENSMASRGQLYSGATQRGLDEGTFQYGRNYDALRRNAESGYQQLSQQEQQAKQGKLQSDLDARSDSINRAPDPEDPGVGPTPNDIAKFILASQKKPKKKNQQNWAYKRTSPNGRTRLG